jgi:hypothetical protein
MRWTSLARRPTACVQSALEEAHHGCALDCAPSEIDVLDVVQVEDWDKDAAVRLAAQQSLLDQPLQRFA